MVMVPTPTATRERMVHALAFGMLAVLIAVAPARAAAQRITIPDGTPVRVELVKTLLPKASDPKQTFKIRVVEDVVVDGYVVVKKGATGVGTIDETASHKFTQVFIGVFHHGSVVALRIHFDWVYAVDGEKIRVAKLTTDGTPEGSNPAVATPAPDYSTTTSMSASNVSTGAIPTVQTFTTYVDSTVHVVSSLPKRGAVENETGFAH